MNWSYVTPIALLLLSKVFMTFAWYGQLKFPGTSLWMVIPISWGIAFFEYCLAVPANRIGYTVYSAAQLKLCRRSSPSRCSRCFRCSIWASLSAGTMSPHSAA